ncbi:MAG TPA: bifunctional GNAT family N-acetyltransferase/class I SAM-dependent methyltransferase [Chthonomonadaceae bacterium]|nr:bifunctional GNAT family N-acetyltransferase/class I SAM-dependent methyltransferase [Chthonomonadaceae bacterium]
MPTEIQAAIRLRPATPEDAERLFAWRNLPEIVALGTTQRSVTWEEHRAWFARTLQGDCRLLFFILHDEQPIGQVRFDREDTDSCQVSLYLLPEHTGHGWGVIALRQACAEAFRQWTVHKVIALIREENARSLSAFRKAGFLPLEAPDFEVPAGHRVVYLTPRPPSLAARKLTREGGDENGYALLESAPPIGGKKDQIQERRLPTPPSLRSELGKGDGGLGQIAYYTERLERYGLDHRALDWGSRASQERRFAILAEIGPLHNASLLDIGCGLADYYAYLTQRGVPVRYTGMDITPAMIAAATKRFPEQRFVVRDILADAGKRPEELERADYVSASGLFTFTNERFLQEAVRVMFAYCRKALAFNALSAFAPQQEPGEFYADPLETVRFCRTLTPWIVLRHDYLPHDFTVTLYREPPQA